jgi:hypothetical protein
MIEMTGEEETGGLGDLDLSLTISASIVEKLVTGKLIKF